MPEKQSEIYSVQILRGVAALLVVARHAAKQLSADPENAFILGQFGVDIFFVISGFVIFLAGRNSSPAHFLKRRFIRVVPMYWLVLALVVGMRMAHGHLVSQYFIPNTLLSFLFVPSEIADGAIFPPIVVGWTLNFEMFFYAVFAVSLCFASRLVGGDDFHLLHAAVGKRTGRRRVA